MTYLLKKKKPCPFRPEYKTLEVVSQELAGLVVTANNIQVSKVYHEQIDLNLPTCLGKLIKTYFSSTPCNQSAGKLLLICNENFKPSSLITFKSLFLSLKFFKVQAIFQKSMYFHVISQDCYPPYMDRPQPFPPSDCSRIAARKRERAQVRLGIDLIPTWHFFHHVKPKGQNLTSPRSYLFQIYIIL